MNTPHVRFPASLAELELVADLLDSAFGEHSPAGIYRTLVQASGFQKEGLPVIWNDAGEALSVVLAVPCRISLLGTWVRGGIITMVGTAPHARGQGFMRACIDAAHQWLRETGYPFGILFGVPDIYPKFNYRPVIPRSETSYDLPAQQRDVATRPVTATDLDAVATLFNAQALERPCAIYRPHAPWVWMEPAGRATIRVLEHQGKTTGYLRYLNVSIDEEPFTVLEAECQAGQESDLLNAIHQLAWDAGRTKIRLRLMPDHPIVTEVNRRATGLDIANAATTIYPPQAGMLCVLDHEACIAQLHGPIEARLGTESLQIVSGTHTFSFGPNAGPVLYVDDPADMAHVLAGYPGIPVLRQWGRLHGDNDAITAAMRAFPTTWPRWSLAPFWGE